MNRIRTRWLVFFPFVWVLPLVAAPQEVQQGDATWRFEQVDNPELPPGFLQGAAPREDGTQQTFYVGTFDHPLERKPLFLYIEGSGAQSQFVRVQNQVAYSLFGLLAKRYASRFHVVAPEKRGVAFAESHRRGTAESASDEYTQHATYAGRTSEVLNLLDTLLAEPWIDPSQVMLIGHSEGADVVSAVAARDPRVTHVAFLAGGGPTQFFDLLVLQRKQMKKQGKSAEEIEEAIESMEDEYRRILADPESKTKMFAGHAYRRWSSFCLNPPVEGLARCKAKVFLAHGSEDVSVPIESFDFLIVELMRRGRTDFYARRYPNRDHSFILVDDDPGYDGFLAVIDEFLDWVEAELLLSR